ncbi:late competence development ComFB family protein [bacterium]|nr:late competence development ComFB family protein [bacterium]
MKLKNYMETAVQNGLDELLKTREDVCKCSRCRLDIIAYTLNNLPAKYVVTDKGHTYTRVAEMTQQFNADVVVALTRAIRRVAKKPRH